jgi:hypothetical protein
MKNAIGQNRTSTGKKDDEDSGYPFSRCPGGGIRGVHQNHEKENTEGYRAGGRRMPDPVMRHKKTQTPSKTIRCSTGPARVLRCRFDKPKILTVFSLSHEIQSEEGSQNSLCFILSG